MLGEEALPTGAGPGAGAFAGTGHGNDGDGGRGTGMTVTGDGNDGDGDRGRGTRMTGSGSGSGDVLLDHERLEVYRVARELLVLCSDLIERKMPRELREQLDRASMSILFNIGEGAGKTAKADKQRSYEIARGSTTEVATQLDLLHIRRLISSDQYRQARSLIVRIAQMLSRLCGSPRTS